MACPSVTSGQRYLEASLTHIDCQAQSIGGFGFAALSDPASPVAIALTAVLVIFVALFGLRIALGTPVRGDDLANHVIRVVIVLTLATSWPAWQALGYDLVIGGPAEISQLVGLSSELPGSNGDLAARLQRVDDGFAYLNERGTGRRGVQNGDWFQLGFARSAFLTGTLGPLALTRLSGGMLLALAPLMAGLLLFGVTRAIFAGWVKALVAIFLATVLISLALGVQLALIEPWLQGVLRLRAANQPTLSAPTEALAMTLSFALIAFGMVLFAAWVAFHPSFVANAFARLAAGERRAGRDGIAPYAAAGETGAAPLQRSQGVAHAVARTMDRDRRMGRGDAPDMRASSGVSAPTGKPSGRGRGPAPDQPLGSSYRRTSLRGSRQGTARDLAR